MNLQDKVFFEALTKDRSENADTLEKPSMSGIKKSVVEKYSDQAHFIYELLQNADDVKATYVRFVLEKDRLIFAHNGKRHFSVTDPSHEKEDSENGRLGDINAITSIANSNKTEASIGKFGVGFKAVFQYTSTPYIYDPDFKFKIERFIVPVLISEDFPERKTEETVFVFPFDNSLERNAERAYIDIAKKLRSLSYPLLFLSNLKEIRFTYESINGYYSKSVNCSFEDDDTLIERIKLTQSSDYNQLTDELFLFSRTDNKNRYSVGFFLTSQGRLKPVNVPAFCFFPTKEITNLHFIIHAPFLLTDSREGIRAGVFHNENMIEKLAGLSADALESLKIIGEENGIHLIDDDAMFEIIPYNSKRFSDISDKSRISFMPFYSEIKAAMKKRALIPTLSGYVRADNAYWAANIHSQLTRMFSDEQLAQIVDNKYAGWAFPTIGREEIQISNTPMFDYISDIVRTFVTEDAVISGRSRGYYYRPGQRLELENIKGIDETFIENQSIEWLHTFYKWIGSNKNRVKQAQKKPIFIDQNGKAAAA